MQVEEFLEQSARRFSDKTALVCGERKWTYREIEERANQLARGLKALGILRGDRVGVCLDNSLEAVLAIFAILKAGGILMMINPTTKKDKLIFILNNSRAKVLLIQSRNLAGIKENWEGIPHLLRIVATGQNDPDWEEGERKVVSFNAFFSQFQSSTAPPQKESIDIDLAALIYTSGSTGTPKGVMVTHLNMISAATSISTYLENTPDEIIFNVLPLSFDYGLYQVLMAFKMGATLVLERSFTFPHAVLEKMVIEKVTGFPLVPTISAILLQMDLRKYDFSSLRYISNTGAVLPTKHISELRKLFPDVKIFSMYGLTECKRVSYLPPDQIDVRPTSVGKGMPNEEVYIVDETGKRLGPGVIGELVIRGSNVMKGYWEKPEETDKVLRPGPVAGEKVLYSGDLFRTDDDGYLYFVGRRDDIIKTRGEKVSPKEVENVLYNMMEISEAAVVGLPDPILGHAIKAVIAFKEGFTLTPKEILSHCAKNLEDFMVPKSIEIRNHLPKTATGKIDKRELTMATEGDREKE